MSFDCFSVEVAELVVDQLSDDVPSLRNVALVCHELLPRARFHPFVHIGVRNRDQMHTLREFLDNAPYICPLVRCVTISTTDDEPHSFTILETIPVPLLTRLPNLRRWKVTNQALDFNGQHWLSLSQSTLASLRKYTAMIGHLSINTLSFSGCADLVRAFADQVQIRRDVSEAAVVSLLEISKSSLQELAIHVTREQAGSVLGGQLSNLNTLTLCMPVEGRRVAFLQAISRIASFFKLLSGVGTVRLQELRVHCYGSSFSALAAILAQEGTLEACKQLEQVLLAFPRHALKFSLAESGRRSRSFQEDPKNSELKEHFPTLWSQGKVTVELPMRK
ncbi:hypothetical protein BD310DRAFT_817397 [Dichomitus squalens]|uniref:Uncharacterized protein n=1 Tax=Dichomitus squalens TaxID=114155 RepID=A0A4Q9PY10_9APHY|nr:hypothetical protein BD310DRAFT_817397 [Dichomitus squalens]